MNPIGRRRGVVEQLVVPAPAPAPTTNLEESASRLSISARPDSASTNPTLRFACFQLAAIFCTLQCHGRHAFTFFSRCIVNFTKQPFASPAKHDRRPNNMPTAFAICANWDPDDAASGCKETGNLTCNHCQLVIVSMTQGPFPFPATHPI
jgi:hypothetical protein